MMGKKIQTDLNRMSQDLIEFVFLVTRRQEIPELDFFGRAD